MFKRDFKQYKFKWNQNTYNRGRHYREFNEGDVVMTSVHKLSNAFKKFNKKLAENYEPALIISKSFNNAYLIMLPSQRMVIADVADLKEVASELQLMIKQRIFNQQ